MSTFLDLKPNYWVGDAMISVDCANLEQTPDPVDATINLACANGIHLALALKQNHILAIKPE
ncbi:hypothetical protein [Pelagibacterium lentulum]|nr:hypothetical protein [Pelagibacterium lentulum]